LHEIENEITGETTAAFEPAIDYLVTKVPRWPKDKFRDVEFDLGPGMKSTGEAMAIGRTFEESLLKALRSSEYDPAVEWVTVSDAELDADYLETPTPDRPYAMFEAFRRGYTVEEVVELTDIEEWYVERYARIVAAAEDALAGEFTPAAVAGFTDHEIAAIAGDDFADRNPSWEAAVEGDTAADPDDSAAVADGGDDGGAVARESADPDADAEVDVETHTDGGADPPAVEAVVEETPGRSFKQVDTCAGEFEATTPYYYSARRPEWADDADGIEADEVRVDPDVESVVVVGGGPIRIGQGVEFDYCAVHAVRALEELGIDAHVVNNNPETVSTDYDTSDGLFFEPLTAEEIADVVETTGADGVMVQFGGGTSVAVGDPLAAELDRRDLDCEIVGTPVEAMDLAEDRDRFNRLLDDRDIAQPAGGSATSEAEALELARDVGYPVLVRPSYVLGGRAMEIVHDDDELREYIEEAVRVSPDKPVLVDEFLADAVELDVDAVSDGEDVLIGGVMEHVESAGVHSGDSACVIPTRSLAADTLARVREVVEEIATALDTVGLLNVQLAVQDGTVYVLEANPRSSRTVPFVSKATGVPIAKLAAKAMAGADLADLDATEQVPEAYSVKEVVLPFDRLPGSDPRLGPEMKSTGEVMGTSHDFGVAYDKAQSAANDALPEAGTVVVDQSAGPFARSDTDFLAAFDGHLDAVAAEAVDDLAGALTGDEIDLLVSADRDALTTAVEEDVPYLSTPASAEASLTALDAPDRLDVAPVSERPTVEDEWG
ncbi:MAG: carbamoyl-phosphate synthase large subunit, partial [Halolamina sp.]